MSKDILHKTWVGSIPNWLRWTLFIPLAVALTLVVSNLMNLLQIAVGQSGNLLLDFIRMAIILAVFIFSASLIAPKGQSKVALILGIFLSACALLLVFGIVLLMATNGGSPGYVNVSGSAIAVALVLIESLACYLAIRKLSQ